VVTRAQGMNAGDQQESDKDIEDKINMEQLEMVEKGIDHQYAQEGKHQNRETIVAHLRLP
jgi:hypothetical protein